MPTASRDHSRDPDESRVIKHQHSSSELSLSRTPVPMWDSSDPDRAPPPLPLNPSSPSRPARPAPSANIAAAAAALSDRTRDGSPASGYMTNPMNSKRDGSPEKSLFRGQQHKRMQSLQAGSASVRDISNTLENGAFRSAEQSPERRSSRANTPTLPREVGSSSSERPSQALTTTVSPSKGAVRDSPSLRSSPRPPPKSILGENTPPQSATMLAIQQMSTPHRADSIRTIDQPSSALVRSPQTFDAISSQILSLTSIATNLQREMTQLSRRSRDNATDLISLKEATNARDEDIRKTLREIVTTLSTPASSRPVSCGPYLLEDKPHASPPANRTEKSVTLPRIPTPNTFAASLNRGLDGNSLPYAADGAVAAGLLEKILRQMGTKEGQDRLMSLIDDLGQGVGKGDAKVTERLEEIISLLTERANPLALVPHSGHGGSPGSGNANSRDGPGVHASPSPRGPPRLELDFAPRRSSNSVMPSQTISPRGNRGTPPSALNDNRKVHNLPGPADVVGDDFSKLLRRLKDSVTETGGMTAEVKALVRELRGEVLGMGRELGRKLQEASGKDDERQSRDEMAKIMQEGLAELKDHMERVMRERRRQSASSMMSRNTVDSQEVYDAVRHAMSELQVHQHTQAKEAQGTAIGKEEIIEAVREAWETYKPEIELQNFGLERDEVLQCLKEGLDDYRSTAGLRDNTGVSRDEVLDAIREGLEHFQPPPPVQLESEASITREEILGAVRECLETFDFHGSSRAGLARGDGNVTREDVIYAVKEGLGTFDFASHIRPASRGLTSSTLGGKSSSFGDQPPEQLQDLLDEMRYEFKAVSDEAKQNVAANGRDTEQVLDAIKDGLERLRSDVETYVDRAADVTGKDEIIEALREGFEVVRADMTTFATRAGDAGSSVHVMEDLKSELEHLRSIIATTIVKSGSSADKDEILDAMTQGFQELRADAAKNNDRPESILSGTGEVLDALSDGLDTLRSDMAELIKPQSDSTISHEILETLKAGLATLRADLDRAQVGKDLERKLGPDGGQMVVAEGLKRNDIENLEVLITQLRIKVEAMDAVSRDMPPPPQPAAMADGAVTKDDLAAVESTLKNMQAELADLAGRDHEQADGTAKKDDIDAIETLLINTKAKIDDWVLPNTESAAKQDQVEAIEALVRETKDAVEDLGARVETESARKEDLRTVESLLRDLAIGLEEVKEQAAAEATNGDRVTKLDIEAIEELCADVKIQVEQIQLPDPASMPTKADLDGIEDLVVRFRDQARADAEAQAQASDERRMEVEGVMERLGEVKGFLNGLKDDLRSKLDEGNASMDVIGKLLEGVGETVGANATVSADIKEVMDLVQREFERSHGLGEGLKVDHESKVDEVLQRLDERFDEIMTKYDDAQAAAEAKARAADEHAAQKDEMLSGTRAIAEELKLLIDTLGATITDSADKMAEDSKTVFNRVDDAHARVEEMQGEERAAHQQTRDDIEQVLTAVKGVRGELEEHHPKLLTTIKDVLLIVSQHYEHSQHQASEDKKEMARIRASSQPPPPPAPATISDVPVKFDDSEVQAKLDKLINHANAAGRSFARIDLLEQIHGQVMATSTEISEFVGAQARLITEDHEDKERQAQEAAIELERRKAQKQQLEADVAELEERKEELGDEVDGLEEDKEELMASKMRLAADVASLETALRLRQEEMMTMEARAERLERRLLDGVIDQSRALLMSRPSSHANQMSLKRVSSQASSKASMTASRQGGLGMALRSRPPPMRLTAAGSSVSGRRILSLNEITANGNSHSKGGSAVAPMPTERGGADKLKRSHSVRTASTIGLGVGRTRRSSWGRLSALEGEAEDKENDTFTEVTEEDGVDGDSEVDTERRTSFSTRRRSSCGTVSGTLGTASTLDQGDEDVHEKSGMVLYDGPADSGVGEELATADLQAEGIVWAE